MKALVLGGNGFIGSHLVDRLVERGVEVVVLDLRERRFDSIPPQVLFIKGDLGEDYLVREALGGIDLVFHLAWTSIHETSIRDPVADIYNNLIPSVQLLEACRWAEVRRIIFISSGGTIYGQAQSLPIPETHPQNPISAYGVTKLATEKYIQMFHHLYGLEYAILRPSVPYGPRQNPFGKQGVIPVFLYRVSHDLPVTIWGNGDITRDFFYISDLARALIAGGEFPLEPDPVFNIGGIEEISLIKLIEIVELTVGKKAKIEFQPSRGFDSMHIRLDFQRAQRVLNWNPQIALQEGIERTWRWMKSIIK
ncbi:NAD-dependent epimerase/dehydratase family protein [Chloroflexota bacterium]